MKKNIFVVFGAPDHESEVAKKILQKIGIDFSQATIGAIPVNAGNAYKATSMLWSNNPPEIGEDVDIEKTIVIFFECNFENSPIKFFQNMFGSGVEIVKCDHHNPGDPGYDKPASEYWEGSSLGQLVNLLKSQGYEVEITDHMRMIASGDHCPAAAYLGQCPGIDPLAFAQFRVEQKMDFYASVPKFVHKADLDLLHGIIDQAVDQIVSAPVIEIAKQTIADLRKVGFVDELPEAALKTGRAYITEIDETGLDRQPTGNKKIVMGGHTTPEAIEAFLAWAKDLSNRVGEPYGNPIRGFAGVVVTPI